MLLVSAAIPCNGRPLLPECHSFRAPKLYWANVGHKPGMFFAQLCKMCHRRNRSYGRKEESSPDATSAQNVGI